MSTLLLPPSSNSSILFLPLLKPVARKWYILAPLLALVGGIFGIFGAAITEFTHSSLLGAYIGAPIIEESLKPCGLYLMQAKWPRVLRNRRYTMFLAALAGVAFAVIENVVYLNIYIEEPSTRIIIWRYTACVAMHALGCVIFSLGINYRLMDSIRGQTRFLSYGKRYFFSAMALHSLYNISVTILQLVFNWFE
jgi:RsiW-degrading membrane proteinase PrsW (M82 family)